MFVQVTFADNKAVKQDGDDSSGLGGALFIAGDSNVNMQGALCAQNNQAGALGGFAYMDRGHLVFSSDIDAKVGDNC